TPPADPAAPPVPPPPPPAPPDGTVIEAVLAPRSLVRNVFVTYAPPPPPPPPVSAVPAATFPPPPPPPPGPHISTIIVAVVSLGLVYVQCPVNTSYRATLS